MAVAVSLTTSPALAATLVRSGGVPERGIDISAYQNANGPINWRELARHGIRFVAIKASEDTYYANPYYLPDARSASRAGLSVLAYAFANPDRAGGAATASFAVRAAHYHRGRGALPLVVDLENDPYSVSDCYWFGRGRMNAWIAAFTSRARALTGSWPIIYTAAAWWQECTGSTGAFGHDPLWLASYGGQPADPAPWARWSFWQYSENGYLPGIGWTDLDYFQSAGGLASPHPASPPKPRHRHKRRAKHKPKHGKPTKPVRKAKHLSVTIHQFYGHKSSVLYASAPSPLISSAGDSAQASPRHRGHPPHCRHRRRPRSRCGRADRDEGIGGARGHRARPGHRRVLAPGPVDVD
jgi:GH25 family lysozyme M1 (1,4-beta-N-acetylmuramidase)